VERLAINKAQSIAAGNPAAIIIGSDQVADHKGSILGKPETPEAALQQLRALSGNELLFYTGLAVVYPPTSRVMSCVVPTRVVFRTLSDEKIQRYLRRDTPYNCAGSFKSESLGSALVEAMTSEDPSALIGLPLIRLSMYLEELGVAIP